MKAPCLHGWRWALCPGTALHCAGALNQQTAEDLSSGRFGNLGGTQGPTQFNVESSGTNLTYIGVTNASVAASCIRDLRGAAWVLLGRAGGWAWVQTLLTALCARGLRSRTHLCLVQNCKRRPA